MTDKLLIHFQNTIYRTAGYRIPEPDDLYISKDGKVKLQNSSGIAVFDGPRLIVRKYNPDKDFKG